MNLLRRLNSFRRRIASTRVRITMVSVLVVGVALALGTMLLDSTLHASALRSARGSAALQVGWVESLNTAGALPNPLPPVDASRLTLVQVVDANHRVLAASAQLAGVDYDEGEAAGEVRVNAGHSEGRRLNGGPWFVDTAPAQIDGRRVTVVVFTSLADYERALDSIDQALGLALPILLVLVAGVSWLLVGRSLRPVERMRREVDTITAGSLDLRVVEPFSADEVSRLAVTLNSMLERLQLSSDRQRRFIADASHELRTPVANVAAALDVALRYPDRTDWPAVVGDVAEQNQRMSRLVDDLLLIATTEHRGDHLEWPPVDIGPLIRESVQRLGPQERGLVRLAEPFPELTVRADPRVIARVLANLLENAARHAVALVEISVRRNDDDVEIAVADDGPGVADDQRDRVFEPFVRLDEHRSRPGGGAGLGLAIVRDLVADASGSVTVADGPLGGAVFIIRFPAAPQRALSESGVPSPT